MSRNEDRWRRIHFMRGEARRLGKKYFTIIYNPQQKNSLVYVTETSETMALFACRENQLGLWLKKYNIDWDDIITESQVNAMKASDSLWT